MKRRRGPTPKREWVTMRFSHALPTGEQVWGNNLYTCSVEELDGGWVTLAIHSHTRNTRHDWRHLQRIKSEVVGPEREAFEIYPAESRVVDTANEYHLWVLPEGEVIPLGWKQGTRADDRTEFTEEQLAQLDEQARAVGRNPAYVMAKSKQRRLDLL